MSKIISAIMFVAITIVLALFIGFGIQTFYKDPKYEDFCGNYQAKQLIDNKEICEKNNGTWILPQGEKGMLYMECRAKALNNGSTNYDCYETATGKPSAYCDEGEPYCSKQFNKVTEVYNRNVFIITLVLGIAGIILVGFVLSWNIVSSGIMGGAVLTIIYGTIRYWGQAPDLVRFSVLTVALIVLLWIGYKKVVNTISENKVKKKK